MSTHTIDTAMARRMAEASAIRGASIIGLPGGWSVMLKLGMAEQPLGTQRTDKVRTWRSLDTCMNYLKNELHIVRIDMLDASKHSTGDVPGITRADSSERMKRAHEAAAYDAWLRTKVAASLAGIEQGTNRRIDPEEWAQTRQRVKRLCLQGITG